jgi:isopentenyl-diphosphate delta-isomerase type 1
MEFDNSFEVPLPPDQAWPVLMDIPGIAPCMPGAQLTEVVDDRTYKGNIAVRLGPVALTFAGVVKFEEINDAGRTARVRAQGNDAKGRGAAQAAATFRLEPSAAGSKVLVHTDLTLSGAVAQYGRGVGMIQATASALMNQFAKNLKARLASSGARPGAAKPISGLSLLATAAWNSLRQPSGGAIPAATRSANNDPVILVDDNDVETGIAGKLDAHQRGLKHRAISVLIRNAAGEFLLQRRAATKYHSGGLWTNACCSHPLPSENVGDAARRRLEQELGFACPIEPLFVFQYNASVPGGLIENEVVHVFGGRHDGAIAPDPAEVSEWKWMRYDDLMADVRAHPEAYTIWFRQYLDKHGDRLAAWVGQG